MKRLWTKEELEFYINYCKFNNLRYECLWCNMEDKEREKTLLEIHNEMLKIDKPVKVYLDFMYVDTVKYSLISFIKEEMPDKILTWIPNNFQSGKEMLKFLEINISKELQQN